VDGARELRFERRHVLDEPRVDPGAAQPLDPRRLGRPRRSSGCTISAPLRRMRAGAPISASSSS
jgi:hypothetical protein